MEYYGLNKWKYMWLPTRVLLLIYIYREKRYSCGTRSSDFRGFAGANRAWVASYLRRWWNGDTIEISYTGTSKILQNLPLNYISYL